MKLYVMRHGQTSRNKINHVLGRSDLPLDHTGIGQAATAGIKLGNIHFDAIYSSPMKRAYQTAEAVCKYQTNPAPILVDKRLIEQNFGIFEGLSREDETYQAEKKEYFKPFEGGESYLDVAARVYNFLDDLTKESCKTKRENILITTHGGIARLIENYFNGMSNDDFRTYFMKNCEVRIYDFPKKRIDQLKALDEFELEQLENKIPELEQEKKEMKTERWHCSGVRPSDLKK
ncbi:histidine phosphatase family protein [Erysipelotrichaceae bacterium 51-3]